MILFVFSPFAYAYISITETDKRTDYPGKEIASFIQTEWNKTYEKIPIGYVTPDEWHAGNLSYHLKSRPKEDLKSRPKVLLIRSEFEPVKFKKEFTRQQELRLLIASSSEMYHSIVEIKSAGKEEINSCLLYGLTWANYYMPTDFKRNGIPLYINFCFIN